MISSNLDSRPELIEWLLSSDEPWTRFRTLVDVLDQPCGDLDVRTARAEMLAHPQVQALIAGASAWGRVPLRRHNDAGHPIYQLSTLADLGVRVQDTSTPGGRNMMAAVAAVSGHQSAEGAFQTVLNIPQRFGGSGEDSWSWMVCDAPTLLYSLLRMGLEDDPCVQRGIKHLAGLVQDNGWRCVAAPELGGFRGPGRKDDPCPIANVYALKALAQVPGMLDSPATRTGAEMLLQHWQYQKERKIYLFGIGTDFRKLKYPFVWYDVLHVVDVLSQLPFVRGDTRLLEMLEAITTQADDDGRFTATSMYRTWKGWSFADKKSPSPWLTFLVVRILRRLQEPLG